VALIVYLLAAGALLAGLRCAVPGLDLRRLACYGLLAGALFAPAMVGPWRQLPLDIPAALPPWSDDPGALPAKAVENPLLSDVVTQMLPFRAEVRDAWTHGALPLWSHRLGTGQPLLANSQTAVLAPFHLVTLGLEPTRAMSVAAALQTFVLLAGADLLALALGASATGALLAAVVAAGSSFHVVWLYHPLGMAFAWVPAFLAGVVGLARGTPRAAALAVAAAFGMMASGQPQIALYASLAGGAAWSWIVWHSRAAAPAVRWRVGRTLGAGALAALLSAPLVLPTLAALAWSERALLLAAEPGTLNPLRGEAVLWLPLVDPFAFGSPRDGNWAGPWNYNETASAWAGTLATALALAAALVAPGLARRLVLGGLVALAVAHRLPPFDLLADALPGLAATTTGRLRLFWPLAVALAAAHALGDLGRSRRLRIASAALLFALALLLASGVTHPAGGAGLPAAAQQAAHVAAVLAALAGAALAAAAVRLPRLAPALFVLLAAAELLLVGGRYHPWVDERLVDPPGAVRALMARADSAHGERVTAFGGRLLPYEPVRFGLADPRGFDPLRPAASLQLLRERLHRPARAGYLLVRPEAAAEPLLDRLAVGWALGPPELAVVPGWREVERFGGTALLRNDEALPLVFVPDEVVVTNGPEAALAQAVVGDQPARRVRIEAAGADNAWSCPAPAPAMPGGAAIGASGGEADPTTTLLANGMKIRRSAAAAPVLLATSISFMPGWSVAPSTSGARLCRVDGAFLALAVDAGTREVELRYRPPRWTATLVLFASGVAGAVIWPLLARRRRRGRTA
jgi:hypothetical protein